MITMIYIRKYILPLLLVGFIAAGAHLKDTADRPLAYVQKFKPAVGVQNQGPLQNVEERGKPLYTGDTLRTDESGFALVQFMDKSLAKVKPDSRLIVQGEIEDKNNSNTRIGLELGEILLNVSEQGTDNFEVATNTAVASVKGTNFGATHEDYYWVEEGEVEVLVNNTGESVTLTDRGYGQVQEDGTIESGELSEEEVEERNQEYEEMEENTDPETYELRFVDEDGEEQIIEIKVYEN